MSDRISARIDPDIKKRAADVFAQLGISEGEAIRMFYRQVDLQQGLPFAVKIPNEETIAAMAEIENAGDTLSRFSSAEDLYQSWMDEEG